MANKPKQTSRLWVWIVIGIMTATLAVSILFYIGWFDKNTHVDTPAGDNVEQQYDITEADSDEPGEADWQNAQGQTLREEITDPAAEPQTPPSPEQ